jgi:virulence factor Mce-like protein
METRTPTFRTVLLPVTFSLLCVVLTLAAYYAFGGHLPLHPKGYQFTVPLPHASNLLRGSDVQTAGVQVGEVVDVKRVGNTAEVVVAMRSEFAPVRSGARAIARTKTLLGEGYLELAPGPRDAPLLEEGGRLAVASVRPNVQLDEFLTTFGPDTRRHMSQMLSGLARATGGRATALNNSLGWSAPVAGNLEQLADVLDSQREDLKGLVASSAGVLGAIGERAGVVRAAVRAGDDVLSVMGERRRGLRNTVRALPPFLRALRGTSRTISAASPDLNAATRALEPVAPLALPALRRIDSAAPEFRELFEALPGTVASAKRGLPSLEPMIDATRRGFRDFYPAAREIIPIVQLMAAYPQVPAAPFANVAGVTNGVMVGPGGLLAHYAKGLPTVFNETIGGWAKRLPTNVLNPYVRPEGQHDIAKLGYVKAFDCRNVDNRAYLPATGTGSPPCVLQGPWEFNGKSAFYPRLTIAPR